MKHHPFFKKHICVHLKIISKCPFHNYTLFYHVCNDLFSKYFYRVYNSQNFILSYTEGQRISVT